MLNKKFSGVIKLVICLALLIGATGTASGEAFYDGKIIRIVVASPPGGGYDTYTRAVARHIGKYIPGNPVLVVQNMVGAGGVTAAHYIYSRAKPDGLTVGVWQSANVLRQALGDRAIKFKSDEFGWIGAPSKGFPTCAVMGFTGFMTFADVLNSKKPIKMGGVVVPGITPSDLPRILNLTLGTQFDVIRGYEGGRRILIAM